jgi:hypothetical protein
MYGGETYTGFWWGGLKEIVHLEDTSVDGRQFLVVLSGSER